MHPLQPFLAHHERGGGVGVGPCEAGPAHGERRPVVAWEARAGIDDADRPHVFDRFYRAIGTRALPGSGLGLAIVAKAADEHGGTTFVANAPHGGAIVGFDIPAP